MCIDGLDALCIVRGMPNDFSQILKLWPSASALAGDLGVKEVTARMWRQRGIPSVYWLSIVRAAEKRRLKGVTLETLARLSAKRRAAL